MKYLLVVGFACDVYCVEPRARIFVGDQFIDEFNIKHHRDTLSSHYANFFKKKHVLHPYLQIEEHVSEIINFPSLRFYEINIELSKENLSLRIEIENNDNNYVNGFMTKNTVLQLQVFHFFPLHQKLLSKLERIKNKNQFSKNYGWYRNKKSMIFNLIFNVEWYGKNKQIFKNNTNQFMSGYKIGGSGHFVAKLVKKYGIFFIKLKRPYRYHFNKLLIDYFFNKYKQHVNQRNSD